MPRDGYVKLTLAVRDMEASVWAEAAEAAGMSRHAWLRAVANRASGYDEKNPALEAQLARLDEPFEG